MARKPKDAGFESTLAELEELVARMEAGNLPLEEAMRSFERGVQLTRECQAALQAAQQRRAASRRTGARPCAQHGRGSPDATAGRDELQRAQWRQAIASVVGVHH